jgi:hypothetical protein
MLTDQASFPEQRLSLWKTFRDEIKNLTTQEQLNRVAEFFARTPIGSRSLDYYTPESWPDPWEILYHRTFCQNSISLLIYYTLVLLPQFELETEIWLVDTKEDRFLIVVADGQYVLNYELGAISTWQELSKNTQVVCKYNEQIKKIS